MSLKGKKVYHGSFKKIEKQILPKKATIYKGFGEDNKPTTDKTAKIYASKNKNFAIAFTINIPKRVVTMEKITYLVINRKDVDKLKTGAYLYTLDSKDFKKNYRFINNEELVAEKPVKILNREYIPNVYDYIMKNDNIRLGLVDDINNPYKIKERI